MRPERVQIKRIAASEWICDKAAHLEGTTVLNLRYDFNNLPAERVGVVGVEPVS